MKVEKFEEKKYYQARIYFQVIFSSKLNILRVLPGNLV